MAPHAWGECWPMLGGVPPGQRTVAAPRLFSHSMFRMSRDDLRSKHWKMVKGACVFPEKGKTAGAGRVEWLSGEWSGEALARNE